MISCELIIEKFDAMGDKSGWTFACIPQDIAQKIKPNFKKIYRVKGTIDSVVLKRHAIMPMGEGNYLLPFKKEILKHLKKPVGEKVFVSIEEDKSDIEYDEDFISCLNAENIAKQVFESYTDGHKNYFNNYVIQANTEATKTKRIVKIIRCLEMGMNYSEMLKDKTVYF